jgi:sigma-B regulation protein RsbU (phosphoserine phosphatase)
VLVRASGAVEHLAAGGPVLGVFPDGTYKAGEVAVESGDRIVLYTDGITEARNDVDEEFGEDRLIAIAVESRACSAPALQARIAEAVASFSGGRFHDDATLIVMAADREC